MHLGDFDIAEVLDAASSSSKTTPELIEIITTQSGGVKLTPDFNIKGMPLMLKNKFHDSPHVTGINSMRQKEQLCDVTFKIGNEILKAHKLILALASPYFLEMFSENQNQMNQSKINIPDSNSEAVKILIEHAYTGEMKITEDNFLAVFSASRLLQMVEIREVCSKCLLEQMTPENCLRMRHFFETQSWESLYQHSLDYVLEHFPHIVDTQEFLELSFEKVQELISNDQLTTYSEENVYNAVIKWIKHDLDNRKTFVSRLIKSVRLPLISSLEFLLHAAHNEKLFEGNSECRMLIFDATKYHLKNSEELKSLQRRQKFFPYIFVAGGENSFGPLSLCEVFSPITHTWTLIPSMKEKRDRCAATILGRYVYVAGGRNKCGDLNTVESYDPLSETWTSQKSMNIEMKGFGICTLGNSVYVCGGEKQSCALNSVEKFDSEKEIWTACPSMNKKRAYLKLAEIENILYAVGGWDSSDLSAVEKYDPREQKWSQVASMLHSRHAPGVAIINNELYCTGGLSSSTCEKFNVRRNAWEPVPDMNNKRRGHELVTVEGLLYAIGGREDEEELYTETVERYNPTTNKWSTDILPMKTNRWVFGAAALKCTNLENILKQPK